MKWKKPSTEKGHAKDTPWAYEETIDNIAKVTDKYWYAFFITSYATAARQGEIIQLQAKHIKIENDFMIINLPTLKMRSKGFAKRELPINPNFSTVELTCFETIKNWVDKLEGLESFLFLREDIKKQSNLRYVRRFATKYLGTNHHFLRHCRLTHCATVFNFNEYKLMKYAGWTHPEYAAWYVRLNFDDLRDAMTRGNT